MLSLAQRVEEIEDAVSPQTRLLRLADLRQAVDAAIVAAIGEVEMNPEPVYLDGGIDTGQWLGSRSEMNPVEAAALCGLARALPLMPATEDALRCGRIGTEKARLLGMARQVDGFDEAEVGLVERIVGVSLRTARRIVGRFVADHREAGVDNPAANEVTLTPRRDGRWRLNGDLDGATATVINNELRRLAEAHRDDETLNRAGRYAVALFDMARRSVTLGERGVGSRPELVLVADVSPYGDIYDARYEDGTPMSRRVFENLTCDATIRGLVINGAGESLDLGRSQRLASVGQRRAAAIRDGGCVFPGCDRPPDDCVLHHIRHWTKHEGPTDLANLCCLCPRHHTMVHSIGFTFIRRHNGQLAIHRPDGTALPWPGQQAA